MRGVNANYQIDVSVVRGTEPPRKLSIAILRLFCTLVRRPSYLRRLLAPVCPTPLPKTVDRRPGTGTSSGRRFEHRATRKSALPRSLSFSFFALCAHARQSSGAATGFDWLASDRGDLGGAAIGRRARPGAAGRGPAGLGAPKNYPSASGARDACGGGGPHLVRTGRSGLLVRSCG